MLVGAGPRQSPGSDMWLVCSSVCSCAACLEHPRVVRQGGGAQHVDICTRRSPPHSAHVVHALHHNQVALALSLLLRRWVLLPLPLLLPLIS